MLTISVLVPTYRRPRDLARCLDALRAQTRPPDELVLVVRDTDAETRDFLAGLDAAPLCRRVVEVTRPGVIAAMNAGLAVAAGDIVAITDDDAAPRPDWLARIEGYFRRSARIGGVGGRDILHPPDAADPRETEDVGRVHWYGRVTGNHHVGVGRPRAVDVLKGVNCAFRREAIAPLGLDERLRGEGAQPHWELRLCLQLRRRGWLLIYDPTLIVDHFIAPKLEGGLRGGSSRRGLAVDAYNETYAVLASLPARRSIPTLVYGFLAGSSHAPGAARLAVAALPGRGRRDLLARFLTVSGARLGALRAAVRGLGTLP